MRTLVLSRVVYELFEWDVGALDDPGSDAAHTIDRQVRLEFADGSVRFVSWSSKPTQYCIGVQELSFFTPGDAVERDLSRHPLWRHIVGCPVKLVVVDPDHQTLEIRSESGSVFLSSHERGSWLADVVTVSGVAPKTGVVPVA